MKKTIINLMFLSILLLSCCISANAFMAYLSFTDCIINADNIGYYTATQVNDDSNEFKLDLIHKIKGDSCSSLYISNEENVVKKKLTISKETFLMFIKKDKSEQNSLLGIFGNIEMPAGSSLCNNANVVEMESIIKIISDLHKEELTQRITDICKLFESEKTIERFAALDYSNSIPFRNSIVQKLRGDIGCTIGAFALSLIDDKEPEIRRLVLKLLLDAPSSLQLKIAPKYLKDPDILCREYAKIAINSATYENKVINPTLNDFEPSPKNSKKLVDCNMDEIQNECKKVLDSRPDIKEKDIKYLGKLVANGKITKQSSDIYISYMK